MNNFKVGLDEVGRGAFAGPLVAGCVAIDPNILRPAKIIITDSKKMTHLQRLRAAEWIYSHAKAFGIGHVSPKLIDKLGLTKASHIAFREAIAQVRAKTEIEELFVDAFYVPRVPGIPKSKQQAIIHGDATIFSISAASIIAKVYRDNLMTKLSQGYKDYLWHKNKGYGTPEHVNAIRKFGTTSHHRLLFLSKI